MSASPSLVPELAAALGEGLGSTFTVLPAGSYAAAIHPELGLAAIVPSDREDEALKAAADLTVKAASGGVAWPAMHFAVSTTTVRPPWLVRAGASMCVDIVSAMAKRSAGRVPLGLENAVKVVAAVASATSPAETAGNTSKTAPKLSKHLLRLMKACVERALDGRSAWVAGVPVDADDLIAPNFMLPALVIDAAQKWTLPVVASKGRGGFLVRLSPDPKSILGYRVSALDASAPVLLFLPMVNLVRRSVTNGECVLDGSVTRFAEFLELNGLDNTVLGDVDVRVASNA